MSDIKTPPSPYLVNLPVDFILVGGGSALLFILLPHLYDGPMTARLLTVSLWLTWLGNWPHISATNHRLYGSRENLRRYPVTAVAVPLLVLLGTVGSFLSPQAVAPYFVKLTLSWVLYHYCGQTIGISLLYARRAGYTPSPVERTLLVWFIYGTFVCRALWSETSAMPLRYFGVVYPRFGVPVVFSYVAAALTYACLAAFLVVLAVRARRDRRLPPLLYLVPTFTQYVWFFVAGPQLTWVQFVPFFHGVQYLAIAWAMQLKTEKEQSDRRGKTWTTRLLTWRTTRWYALNFAGGAALFYVLPRVVQHSTGVGRPFAMAVIFAAVQVHHSFVDGVIWKLRQKSVAQPLLVHVPALVPRPADALLTPEPIAAVA